MTTGEKLLLGLAACLGAFGLLILVGVLVGLLEHTSRYTALTDVSLGLLLGVLPIVWGLWLWRRVRRRVADRRTEGLENTVLRLAVQHHGVLTAMDVVVNSSLSVDHAKSILDQLNLKGLNDIHVSDSGIMTYTFRI